MTEKQAQIFIILDKAKREEQTVHLDDLCSLTNQSTMTVKLNIRKLRQLGYPICSGRSGYWIGNSDEYWDTFRAFNREVMNKKILCESMLRYLTMRGEE